MNEHILIVDDDTQITSFLERYLQQQQFRVSSCGSAKEMRRTLANEAIDLCVLDINLPDADGFELTREIRRGSNLPIIVLSVRDETFDRIFGLEFGADDYVTKPFEPRELVARIHSVLRRTGAIDAGRPQVFGKLEIDFAKHKAILGGQLLDLTTNEFAALALLVKNAGKVLNRDQILQELRGIDCDAFNRSVDITMSRLRQKLHDDPKAPIYIKTVWGAGYAFIGGHPDT